LVIFQYTFMDAECGRYNFGTAHQVLNRVARAEFKLNLQYGRACTQINCSLLSIVKNICTCRCVLALSAHNEADRCLIYDVNCKYLTQ